MGIRSFINNENFSSYGSTYRVISKANNWMFDKSENNGDSNSNSNDSTNPLSFRRINNDEGLANWTRRRADGGGSIDSLGFLKKSIAGYELEDEEEDEEEGLRNEEMKEESEGNDEFKFIGPFRESTKSYVRNGLFQQRQSSGMG